MYRYLSLSMMGIFLFCSCGRGGDSPIVSNPNNKTTETPSTKPSNPQTPAKPKEPKKPKPNRPLTGYEGYMMFSDAGYTQVPVNIPIGVQSLPHLWLVDREGNWLGRDIYKELIDKDPELEGCCESSLSVSSRYLALVLKYDFGHEGGRHASRAVLINRQTMELESSVRILQPESWSNEWVKKAFTLSDGSAYLAFTNKHYYRLDPKTKKLSPLSGVPQYRFVKYAYAYEDRGIFTMQDDANVYMFKVGSSTAEKIGIKYAHASVEGIANNDDYCLLKDKDGRYFLFSLSESRVLATFRTDVSIGRSFYYDEETQGLYFAGIGPSDAHQRSIYRIKIEESDKEQYYKGNLYYRISGRTEADSRQGYFLSVSYSTSTNKIYVSWLDQGRSGPAVENRTKMVVLPLAPMNGALPVKSEKTFEVRGTYNINSTFYLSPM